ncbi:response regulator [Caballeronia sp. ATUFL_F1_KS39]|uniref:response regulator n=1 Tax=Caballeronia sp. ATUFL_F1_KS39 TaxID=2921766 RepID=UPI002028BEAA|nr:response regulator [Caballeronia sp. ATUFL_F1_KS39]
MKRILIVDDSRDTADMLGEIAVVLGHNSTVVYDGASAVSAAAAEAFDLIFLDLWLPDTDGQKVCIEIRKGRSGSAHIVALTGSNELIRSGCEGFDEWILKPLLMDDVERLLA